MNHLIEGKSPEHRSAVADIVYRGIVDVLKAPDGDCFVVVGEHAADNLIYDPTFLGFGRPRDFILIQVTSTVGDERDTKFAFYRSVADQPDDIMINMVFVDAEDWSFGGGQPW